MEYQYEADNVAQLNICWIIIYSACILLGTFLSSRLMQRVIFEIMETNINHVYHPIDQRNSSYHS